MSTWLLTSPEFEGEIVLEYDDEGRLLRLDIRAKLTDGQRSWFVNNLPPSLAKLQALLKSSGSRSRLEEVTFEPRFDDFWIKYDDRTTSSRKRSLAKWNRMSKMDQLKAYRYINRYFAEIPYGTRKKFAETYLNSELWNN